MNGENLTFIDLFAGAGGLSEGFIRAGYEPVAHVEMDKAACFTLRTRIAYHWLKNNGQKEIYLQYLRKEITRKQLYASVPENLMKSVINLPIGRNNNRKIHKLVQNQLNGRHVDLIVGGPPCQAYSLAGRSRSKNKMKKDKRNYLYRQYAIYLEKYNPRLFVFENVLGLKSAKGGAYLLNMEKLFLKKGYKMKLFTVEANNFGVLQNRRRVIIIGWKKNLRLTIPDLEQIRIQENYTVNDLLNDLPQLNAGEGVDKYTTYRTETNNYLTNTAIRNGTDVLTQHIARPHTDQDKLIYEIAVEKWNAGEERLNYNDLPENLKTHTNRTSFFDRFKVVAGNLNYSQTVVAHIAKDGHYYIHPDINQNRSLSVREAARLQSFPDDYYFEGMNERPSRTAAFKQIGNAVPVLMGEVIANTLKRILEE